MVHVEYISGLCNRLFQYCFGRILAERLHCSLLCEPIEGFPEVKPIKRFEWPSWRKQVLTGHVVDLDALVANGRCRHIVLRGYFQRYEYYAPYRDAIKQWLRTSADGGGMVRPGPQDLTIAVRSGDIWQSESNPQVHPDYVGLPFSFYRRVVEAGDWANIAVVTEVADDPMVQKLAVEFGATIVSQDPLLDFEFIRASSNIVLAVSTFSWWAAWLSDARRIVQPIVGIMDPHVRPDVNLVVHDEARYERLPLNRQGPWTGSPEERRMLLTS